MVSRVNEQTLTNRQFRTVEIFEDTREVRFGRKPGLEVEFDLKYRFISAVHCRVFSQINPKTQQREFFVQDFRYILSRSLSTIMRLIVYYTT